MALVVDRVSKNYPTPSGPLPVLREVTLTLNAGEALAVVGPSGSGKSTLLHILGTLDRPTSGTIVLNGTDPFTLPEPELADFRNRQIGFVFQDHHLLPQCTALENVLVPTLVRRDRPAEGAERATELLELVGLKDRRHHRPAELSGGERQRVALARALIQRPAMILADEPTGNLDRTTARAIGELLVELHRQRSTILIVVTHSPELAALMPNRSEMWDGRLEAGGSHGDQDRDAKRNPG